VAGVEVRFEDVWKSYEAVIALRGVTLTAPGGRITVLLGQSGCGKTTLLKIAAGLLEPDRGRVYFNGVNYTRVPAERRDVGMVFQDLALFPHMSVFENVAFGLRVRGVRGLELERRVREVLDLVSLDRSFYNRRVTELSGGQQQRVALARALVIEPKVLLLDEPLAHLDYKVKQRLLEEVRRIQRSLRITTIYVTHDQLEAMAVGDVIAVMRDGYVVQVGTPREVYENPRDLYVASFFGDANILDPRFAGLDSDGLVALRFEDVILNPNGDVDVVYEGVVEDIVFQGAFVSLEVNVNNRSLKLLVPRREFARQGVSLGSRVRVGWKLSEVRGFNSGAT
jgi:ABC-type Fe3+/spermidine/putrescine transport system ATPase subunit